MKTPLFSSLWILLATGIFFVIPSCTLTIPATMTYESNANNMVVIEDLGVGFDYIFLDPEDMARSSVRNRGVRPRIFEFETDPNPHRTIDIPVLGNQPPTRYNHVLGVDSETNPRFEWIEEARLIYSARDFQNAYQTSFSASGGAPVSAAFSASASYGQVKQTTSSKSDMYVYKDGIFRGHMMELDPYYPHQLTESFKLAVARLDQRLHDTAAYRQFILDWGTHFSRHVTIGAKCSYRETISKEFASSNFQNNQQFHAAMSARMGIYEASFGGGTDRSGGEGNQQDKQTSAVRFISYGGSGAGTTSFKDWSEAAVVNSTLIDVKLASYLELFNSRYFPADTLIAIKHDRLKSALKKYDSLQVARIDTNFADTAAFFKDEVIQFKVEISTLVCLKSKEWDDNKVGNKWRSQYWGSLAFELLDKGYLARSAPKTFFDRKEDRGQKGTDPHLNEDSKPLILSPDDGGYKLSEAVNIYRVSLSQIANLSISVTGQLYEMQNWGNQKFPPLNKKGAINTIDLSEIKGDTPKEMEVKLTSDTSDDELMFTIKVTRLK